MNKITSTSTLLWAFYFVPSKALFDTLNASATNYIVSAFPHRSSHSRMMHVAYQIRSAEAARGAVPGEMLAALSLLPWWTTSSAVSLDH